jgi:hypothetical protein
MLMFSYLAFKGLSQKEKLRSPMMGSQWTRQETPWGEFLGLSSCSSAVQEGYGVFAADYKEAQSYGAVFLVFPDPQKKIILGESGWRAERAFILRETRDEEEAARVIWAAYLNGYPQVPEILVWAATFIGDEAALQAVCLLWEAKTIKKDSFLFALRQYGDKAFPVWMQLCHNASKDIKEKIPRLIDGLSKPYALEVLSILARDPSAVVRTQVAYSLARYGEDVLPLLEKLIESSESCVRRGCLTSIQNLGR